MFKNIFNQKKDETLKDFMETLLQTLLEKGGFNLSFSIDEKDKEMLIDIFGEDEALLKARGGRILLALQIYLNCAGRGRFPEEEVFIKVDSSSYFDERDEKLLHLAEKLKEKALSTGEEVCFRKSLPPAQRRKIHQLLNEDGEVKTSSIGDGFYKNICIRPVHVKHE